jgi:hypothetical protein
MNTRRRLIAAALASPVVLAACKVRTINEFPVTPADVRAVNLMLGSTGVDILDGDQVVFGALPFEAGTAYVEFDNERKTFVLRFTGQTTELANVEVPLAGEQSYTLVAFGTTDFPQLLSAPDVTSSSEGNVQIRLVNAAFGSPNYDVYITAPDVELDGSFAPNFIGIQGGSSTVSLRFEKATYRVRATPNGSLTVVYDSGPVDFTVSDSVDLFLYQLGSQSQATGMIMDVNGAMRQLLLPSSVTAVRLVNAAYQSGTIRGKVDGTVFTQDLVYPAVSGYGFPAAGLRTISVENPTTPGVDLASVQYAFEPSRDHSVVAVGPAGAVQLVVLEDDNRIPPLGGVRVRFTNMSSDGTVYDVFIGDVKQIVALAPRTASPYVILPAGVYTVTFRDPASGAIAITVPDLDFDEGRITTIHATGVAGNANAIRSTER